MKAWEESWLVPLPGREDSEVAEEEQAAAEGAAFMAFAGAYAAKG